MMRSAIVLGCAVVVSAYPRYLIDTTEHADPCVEHPELHVADGTNGPEITINMGGGVVASLGDAAFVPTFTPAVTDGLVAGVTYELDVSNFVLYNDFIVAIGPEGTLSSGSPDVIGCDATRFVGNSNNFSLTADTVGSEVFLRVVYGTYRALETVSYTWNVVAADDTSTAGDDTSTGGDDTSTAGDDTSTAGDDTSTAGAAPDTSTAGDDTSTAGDDTSTAGDDTSTAGDDTVSSAGTLMASMMSFVAPLFALLL